jgi:hypothetical protein
MLCEFDQIRLPKRIAIAILAGTHIYGALVIYSYWDSAHEEIAKIGLALALLVVLLSYFIYQFVTGGTMTVGIAVFEYDDNEWNIACRWGVFIISIITFIFLPSCTAYWVT